jgi:hypothetical protein
VRLLVYGAGDPWQGELVAWQAHVSLLVRPRCLGNAPRVFPDPDYQATGPSAWQSMPVPCQLNGSFVSLLDRKGAKAQGAGGSEMCLCL